jgi:putative DNA primase/helicase
MSAYPYHSTIPVNTNRETPEPTLATRVQQALELMRQGYNVIPTGADKLPLIKWTEGERNYQLERVTEAEVRDWWSRWPRANIGIVTGAISGIFAIDADDSPAVAKLRELGMPRTMVVRSRRGFHYYYKHPGFHVYNIRPFKDEFNIDVRGDGGIITAPGSVHHSGHIYVVVNAEPIVDGPEWILEKLREKLRPRPKPERTPLRLSYDEHDQLRAWAGRALDNIGDELAATLSPPQ